MSTAQSIGPYQVLRRLGFGGMGEVLLAYDPRLDREVAIKRILPDAPIDNERRARFQREARLAAGLHHPAIVQIFDLLSEDGIEHIIMEYVPGPSLRQRLKENPLPIPDALRIARMVAEGLAYAHQRNIVHRDLKSENVLLSPEGQAKITDFGIARRLFEDPDSETHETLTRDGAVLGTIRSMSPEQVQGWKVDARSDLFSFGVMLYECFAGTSPFLAESPMATASRILTFRPRPVAEVVPEVPEALSELLEQLLEKEPVMRPRDAGEVATRLRDLAGTSATDFEATLSSTDAAVPITPLAAEAATLPTPGASATRKPAWQRWRIFALALIGCAALIAIFFALKPAPPLIYVAVLQPEIEGNAPAEETEFLAFAIRNALTSTLANLEGVSPKPRAEVDSVSGGPTAVARAVAADEVLAPSIVCQGRDCSVELERIRSEDGVVIWSDNVPVALEDLLTATRAMTSWLHRGYPEYRPRAGVGGVVASSEDYTEYLDIRKSLGSRPRGSELDQMLDRLAAIRRRSDRFVDVYLLEANIAVRRFHETREPALLDRASDLVSSALKFAPNDPDIYLRRVDIELAAGQLDEAEATIKELERLIPGDVRTTDRRARILDRRGKQKEALELYGDAILRRPSWRLLYNHASLAYRIGELESAQQSLEAILERSPGNYRGLSLLAQLELSHGDPFRAVLLFEELVSLYPAPGQVVNLGVAYMLVNRLDEAASSFERAVAEAPANHTYLLNLADNRWLQGRSDEAEQLYRQVLTLLDAEVATNDWQLLTVRAQALARVGEKLQAVATIQEALQLAPESGQVAVEAALVYSAVGDDTAALVNAVRAHELGFRSPWFCLQWFERLQASPQFTQILEDSACERFQTDTRPESTS